MRVKKKHSIRVVAGSKIYQKAKWYLINKPFKEKSINILHDRRIIFVHNPKVAGTSFKKALGLSVDDADHRMPAELVYKKTWESYFSIVYIRNPFDRLVSSFNYHTSDRYPDLKEWSFERYFEEMKRKPYAIRPQVEYIKHIKSIKPVDFIGRFESLHEDTERVFNDLDISISLPKLNVTPHKHYQEYFQKDDFQKKVISFYSQDMKEFGYSF
jgi:hypothetical protein